MFAYLGYALLRPEKF
ncbi:potassium-transporting ATPase subunit F [Salmonella enterica]